ncbi:exodeoxyribonuclease III [Thiohalomonas denitrificans]|uniref:Exodeoxyribonuclease-3 n=1 Tax=Thiohalomonas denitrificans TaxID=415747 RepID=A0A1G5QQV9_9GAMM|nr:exodeoxyribonuclease III [Thiohalomonas denitrificans]SCZ64274.1 exodeoxyribonuclease-3 [Thiohalomonas denitrificans]
MKIASWNVNSLRVRLPHVLDWLERHQPDFLALQEIKAMDDECPIDALRAAGYHTLVSGQKSYNGVAILSREAAEGEVIRDLPGFDDPARRVLAADYSTLRLINLYVPNGQQVNSDKYRYKLEWLEHLTAWLKEELRRRENVVVVGDFNIAPEPRDVYDPELWEGRVLFSEPERAAFRGLLQLGLADTFRLFQQEEGSFSWWDYRMGAFRRNRGLRIDHILASPALCERCIASGIDAGPRRLERPSDHAPVVAEFRV